MEYKSVLGNKWTNPSWLNMVVAPKHIFKKIKNVTIKYIGCSFIKFKGRQKLQCMLLGIYIVKI